MGSPSSSPAVPTGPRLHNVDLHDLLPGSARELAPARDVDHRAFDGLEHEQVAARGVRLDSCSLRACDLGEVDVQEGQLFDVVLAETRAVALAGADSAWCDVVLERCRAGALTADGARLRRVVLRGCRIDLLSLRGAVLEDVLLEDCDVRELDLSMAELTRVAVRGTRVERLVVHATSAVDVDLRDASVAHVDGVAGLRGMTVEPTQLVALGPSMATELGIVVVGADDAIS